MHRSSVLIAASLGIAIGHAALAQELQISCRFDNTLMKSSKKERAAEKEAWEWYDSESFRQRTFVLNLDSQKIVDGPGHHDVWRDPRVELSPQKLQVQWRFWSAPLPREAHIELQVDRFTGEAIESYSMLKSPNQGPRLMYWGRTGKCRIERRQF